MVIGVVVVVLRSTSESELVEKVLTVVIGVDDTIGVLDNTLSDDWYSVDCLLLFAQDDESSPSCSRILLKSSKIKF